MPGTKKDREQQLAFDQVKQELLGVRSSLEQAYCVFNSTSDPAALDSAILEISALRSKYGRMLRDLKTLY